MKVFAAMYNPCTEESVPCTISLHLTKEGAEKAIKSHRAKRKREWKKLWEGEECPVTFAKWEEWFVSDYEILP